MISTFSSPFSLIQEVTSKPANNGSRYEEDDKKEIRLAISIMKFLCKETKNIVDGMTVYTLPLETTILNASFKFRRFSFGRISTDHEIKKKTILLVGATGSGKTTWINAMINYVLGVEWDDPFRFLLVDEKVRRPSQAHSQTQSVTYDIHYREGFLIPFSLTIVDTPGYIGEMERDNEITSAIQEFVNHPNDIQVYVSKYFI